MRNNILAAILAGLLFSLNAGAATTVIGTVADASGGLLANGTIQFKLSQEGTVTDPLLLLQNPTITCTITTGVITACSVRGNDEISPAGTVYRVQIFDADGITLLPARNYSITGATWDIGTQTPNPSSVQTGIHGASLHSGDVIPPANQEFGAFYSDFGEIAVPANPGANVRRLFVSSATGQVSVRTNAGTTVSLEAGGGGGATHQIDAVALTSQDPINFLDTPEFDWTNPAAGNLSLAIKAASVADSKLAQITTASKVSGAALTSLGSVPAGAGDLPLANLTDGTGFLKGAGGAGTPAYAAIADGDLPSTNALDSELHTVFSPNADPGVDHSGLSGGVGITEVGGALSFDAAEIGTETWLDNADRSWTFDIAAAGTNPVIAFSSGIVNLSTGAWQEGGNAVPNSTDKLDFFSATTSAEFLGAISDETGTTGLVVASINPTLTDVTINDLITFIETAGDATCAAGDYWWKGNSTSGLIRGCENGTLFTPSAGGGAPTGATYITQTPDATLSAEQALDALASGIMRVDTAAGVITSLTDSAGVAANISDERGTGVMQFSGQTIELSILDSDAVPDASGNVWAEPFTIAATNDNWRRMVWVFNDTGSARDCLHGGFLVPQDYQTGGTASFNVVWSSSVLTNDVEWDLDYRGIGGNDTESFDQATAVESLNANDVAPSATWERLEIALGITEANLAAGDDVEFFLCRDKSDAGDTLVGDAYVFRLIFSYTN